MRSLKSTTAALLAVSLALPAPSLAQGQGQGLAKGLAKQAARDLGLEMCGDDIMVPCVTEEASVLIEQPDLAATLEACTGDALPCVTEEGFVEVASDSDLALQAMDGQTTAEAGAAAEAEVTEEAAEETAEAEAETEMEAEAEAQADAEVSTIEEDTTAETEVPPEAEGQTEEAAAPETSETPEPRVTELEGEAEAEAEAEMAETPAEDADAEAEVEMTEAPAEDAEAQDQDLVQIDPEAEAEAEATADAEADADAGPMAGVTQALEEALSDEAADAEAEETAEQTAEEDAADTEETAEAQTPEPEETVIVEEVPTAAAASAEGEATAEAEVETEEVTEETARSSSEDFETAITSEATAQATTPDDDSGLSNFEKALLLGLGAVAVGSILDSGEEVVSNTGDRLVLQDNQGNLRVLKNDDALLRQPGAQVQTETFNDGSTRTTVTRDDGTRIITIRDASGRVLRRVREFENGERVVLFDDTEVAEPVDVSTLPEPRNTQIEVDSTDEDALRVALAQAEARDAGRSFSLNQVRQIRQVRELAPELNLDAITFPTGSAAIQPSQAEELASLGRAMSRIIEERPGEVFLIEGHTDAVGSATYNLALSDRRAETVALALSEYFDVPPENMITQGYGESALKVQTLDAERANRRATIRRITPLLQQAALGN